MIAGSGVTRLVVLRGNSGSAKSSVAAAVRAGLACQAQLPARR